VDDRLGDFSGGGGQPPPIPQYFSGSVNRFTSLAGTRVER